MRGGRFQGFWTLPKVLALTLILIAASGSIIIAAWPAGSLAGGTPVAPGVTVRLPPGTSHLKVWTSPATPASLAGLGATRLETLSAPLDYQASDHAPRGTQLVFQTQTGLTSPVFEAFFDQQAGR